MNEHVRHLIRVRPDSADPLGNGLVIMTGLFFGRPEASPTQHHHDRPDNLGEGRVQVKQRGSDCFGKRSSTRLTFPTPMTTRRTVTGTMRSLTPWADQFVCHSTILLSHVLRIPRRCYYPFLPIIVRKEKKRASGEKLGCK